MEVAESAVFFWTGHDFEVGDIADGLEVAADDEEVDFVVVEAFGFGDGSVDGVESAMALEMGKSVEAGR